MKKKEFRSATAEKNYGNTLLRFITKESIDHQRSKTWFFVSGVIALIGVLYGIFSDSLSFSLLCILLVGVYTLTHKKPSPKIEVLITDLGVRWGERFFQYSQIQRFWIVWMPGEVEQLHFTVSEGFFWREVIIPIFGQDPAQIRSLFAYHVPEVEGKRERTMDFIARKIKL
jgi:hypothetical protein